MQYEEVIRVGKLNLVDLAGSENVAKSGASGGRVSQQEVLTWAPPDFIQLILLTIYCN